MVSLKLVTPALGTVELSRVRRGIEWGKGEAAALPELGSLTSFLTPTDMTCVRLSLPYLPTPDAQAQDPELFDLARVGLGCLGVVAEVTLQVRAAVWDCGLGLALVACVWGGLGCLGMVAWWPCRCQPLWENGGVSRGEHLTAAPLPSWACLCTHYASAPAHIPALLTLCGPPPPRSAFRRIA